MENGTMSARLRQTPLHAEHQRGGGRLVDFAGWHMPVDYRGITEEHLAVRTGAGLFDVSHMGQFAVRGEAALAFLDDLLPASVRCLGDGQMLYAPMCNEKGGCIDDLIVYRSSAEAFLLVVNAGRAQADWRWIVQRGQMVDGVDLQDESAQTAMIALQGPAAEGILSAMIEPGLLTDLAYYRFCNTAMNGCPIVLSRCGYTGEDGFEIMCDAQWAAAVWDALASAGAVPCGLGARDTLRTEMGFPLYGHELTEDITPLEAGIGWTIDWNKPAHFLGREALSAAKKEGSHRLLRGIKMIDKGIPRTGYMVEDASGQSIGIVSSGTQSPSLKRGIGLAFLQREWAHIGSAVYLSVRGRTLAAQVVRLPFVKSKVKRAP